MSGILDIIIAEAARQELKDAKQDLTEFVALLEKAANSKVTFAPDTSSISALKKEVENLKATIADLKKVNQGALDLDKKLATAKKQRAEALSDEGKELQKIRTERNLANAATRKEFKDTNALNSKYNQLNKVLKSLELEYQNLATKKAINAKLSIKEEARMSTLALRAKKLGTAYKRVGADMDALSLTTGRQKSTFDSLGFSVAQLTRESPAFLNSMNTGFMAISNNIPIFVDEINKLVAANKLLKAQGKEQVNIWKKVGSALFSWQSLISFGVVLLTLYGKDIVEFTAKLFKSAKATDNLKEVQKELNKVKAEGIKNAGQELATLKRYSAAVSDVTKSEKEREGLLKQIREKYGEDIKHLTDKEILTSGLASAEEDLAKAIILRATAEEASKKIGENISKIIDLQVKRKDLIKRLAETSKSLTEASTKRVKTNTLGNMVATEAVAVAGSHAKKQKDLINNSKELSKLHAKNNELMVIAIANIDALIKKQRKRGKEDPRERAEALELESITLKRLRKQYEDRITYLTSLALFEKDDKKREALEGEIALEQKKLDHLNSEETERKSLLEVYNEQIKRVQTLIDLSHDESELQQLVKIKKALEDNLKLIKSGKAVQLSGQEDIVDGMNRYLSILKTTAEIEKTTEEERIERLQKIAEALQIVNDFQNAFADLGIALTERRIVKLEEERDAFTETIDAQIEEADRLAINEQEKEEKKRLLKEEKDRKQKAIDKEIAKEKTKQAKIAKAAALTQAAISTALSVIGALSQTPFTPANYVFAALNAALGAVQIATIAAQPIPKFKMGKESSKKYEGFGFVNDGKDQEFRQNEKGIEAFQGKNTLTWVNSDDIIHPNLDAMLDYNLPKIDYDGVQRASLMTSLQIDRYKLNNVQSQRELQENLNNERFKNDVKEILKGWKFNNNIDNTGVGQVIADAIENSDYTNNLLGNER